MKNIRSACAVITSVVLLFGNSLTGVSASDEHWLDSTRYFNADSFAELDNGDASIQLHENLDGFVVITDASGLNPLLFTDCNIYEENRTCDWGYNLPATMQSADNRYYVIDDSATIYRDDSYEIQIPYSSTVLRHIMLESNNIKYIIHVSREMDGIAQWGGDFVGVVPTGSIDPTDSEIDCSTFSGYVEALNELKGTTYENVTDYELLCAAYDKAKELENSNPSKCDLVFPTITATSVSDTAQYIYADIWENVGDIDGINGADASDAAEVLILAANLGVGLDSGLTKEQERLADVNADGVIDASDAALIMQYAAAVGSGNNVGNLGDFLLRN